MIAVPFFSFSLSPLSLLTIVLSSSPSSSCLSSKTTDPPPSPRQFSFHLPSLGASSFSLFLHFFLFSLSLSLHPRLHFLRPFQPRRPSLCNIINTAKFTSVYIHHAPRVQHSRRGEKPRAFSRARINRVTDCYWGPRSSFPYVSRPMMKVLCTIVSKHCRTIIICEYNWTMNRFVVPLQFKSLIYFKTKKNSERIDISRHVINVYLC